MPALSGAVAHIQTLSARAPLSRGDVCARDLSLRAHEGQGVIRARLGPVPRACPVGVYRGRRGILRLGQLVLAARAPLSGGGVDYLN